MAAKKKGPGRPSKKSAAVIDAICSQLAEGKSLSEICEADDMPSKGTVVKWALDDAEFFAQYARARDIQADGYADEIIRLADEADDVNKARLQIDARKWVVSKILPKKYGDKVSMEHTGELNAAVVILPDNGRPERNTGEE